MNPWSRLQWVNKRLKRIDKERVELNHERKKLRDIMVAELHGWPDYNVTRRESEVLAMMAGNPLWTNKEIANKLSISDRTVKFHISSLLKKFDATNRQELMMVSSKNQEAVQ